MNNNLTHHSIKGQKWGVRRYQNEDGSPISNDKKKSVGKAIGIGLGVATIGAIIAGTTIALKRKSRNGKIVGTDLTKAKMLLAKGKATEITTRTGMSLLNMPKDVIKNGQDFIKNIV